MAGRKVYMYGVPADAQNYIREAIRQVYGNDNAAEYVTLQNDDLRYTIKTANNDVSVILVILDSIGEDTCKDIAGGLYNSAKYCKYVDNLSLVRFLNRNFGSHIQEPIGYQSMNGGYGGMQQGQYYQPVQQPQYNYQNQGYQPVQQPVQQPIQQTRQQVSQPPVILPEQNNQYGSNRGNIDQLKNQINDLTSKIKVLEGLDEKNKNLQKQLDSMTKAAESKDKQIEELKDRVSNISETIANKDGTIRNLRYRNEELYRIVDTGGTLSEQQSELLARGRITDKQNEINDKDEEIEKLNKQYNELEDVIDSKEAEINDWRTKYDNLMKDYSYKTDELTKARVDVSQKAGLLRDREEEINRYKGLNDDVIRLQGELDKAREEKQAVEYRNTQLMSQIVDQGAGNNSYNSYSNNSGSGVDSAEVQRIQSELDEANKEKDRLNNLVLQLQSDNEINKDNKDSEDLKKKLKEVSDERDAYKSNYEDTNSTLVTANQELIKLRNKLKAMEDISSGMVTQVQLSTENTELQDQILDIKQSFAYKFSNQTAVDKSMDLKLGLTTDVVRYSNIRFVYSGTDTSLKLTHESIKKELQGYGAGNFLIVDVETETPGDYVYEVKQVKKGLDWFKRGGKLNKYVSKTGMDNVKYLSMGLKYTNDLYYLTIDWNKRLRDLQSSGYNVILIFGSLSNAVVRTLYFNFSDVADSEENNIIYVKGGSFDLRNLYLNLSGFSKNKKAMVAVAEYQSYSTAAVNMYNKIEKLLPITVLSKVKKGRKG